MTSECSPGMLSAWAPSRDCINGVCRWTPAILALERWGQEDQSRGFMPILIYMSYG